MVKVKLFNFLSSVTEVIEVKTLSIGCFKVFSKYGEKRKNRI